MRSLATCLLSLCAAGILSATSVTVTAKLVNAGTKLADSRGDLVGPYTLSVNGINYAAMCVDYSNMAKEGVNYSAVTTQVGSSNLSSTYNPGFGTQYKEEAYLMSLILQPNSDRVDIQDAAWAITDSSYKAGATAKQYISIAQNNYNSIDLSKFFIVSGANARLCDRPQEFLIDPASAASPEPGTLLLMGAGCLAIGFAKRKRRSANSNSNV